MIRGLATTIVTLAGIGLLLTTSCAAPKSAPISSNSDGARPPVFLPSPTALKSKLLWKHKLEGLGTDLELSHSGKRVLLATVPDPETGMGHYGVTMLNEKGKTLWYRPSSQVKAESISPDGTWVVISTYDDELIALDGRSGRKMWTAVGDCRPVILNNAATKRIFCWHDDDAEPGIAFDLFDWKGKKVGSQNTNRDLLNLKASEDQKYFAAGFQDGHVTLFGPDFKPVWDRQLDGKIVDLAVSSGDHPRVAVLSRKGLSWRIELLDGPKEMTAFELNGSAGQVEISEDGRSVVAYGNGHDGQRISFVAPSRWEHRNPENAEYSSQISFYGSEIFVGYFETALAPPSSPHSRLLVLDTEGKLKATLSPTAEEGSYVYGFKYSPAASTVVIVNDDGTASAYRLSPSE